VAGGGVVDPLWDLRSLAGYNDAWPRFITRQVRDRVPLVPSG
jgi:hypothetical protein